jgi:propionyl-CoA synthetase
MALIYDSPVTDTIKKYTYTELRDEVAKFAGVLKAQGVEKGDRVLIYMPMIAEAAMAMLACARIGAVHSVVFGGFAAKELATRINDAKPKVIVIGLLRHRGQKGHRLQAAAGRSHRHERFQTGKVRHLAAPHGERPMIDGRDVDWVEAMAAAPRQTACRWRPPIRFTSFTPRAPPASPKGVVRDNGGHVVALKWTMKNIYNVDAGDVYWAASDVGWVVGHSYIVYGPLFKGCTTILFEGKPVGTPDAGVFWRVIAQHKVKTMFTAPTAFRAIKREDPNAELIKKYDLSNFKALFPGRRAPDPNTLHWAEPT